MSFIKDRCSEYKCSTYIETFLGGGGSLLHAINTFQSTVTYHATDIKPSMVLFFKALVTGWLPSRFDNNPVRVSQILKGPSSPEKAFFGLFSSFRGIYKTYDHKTSKNFDKAVDRLRVARSILQTVSVEFINAPYTYFSDVKNAIIYCDPPYKSASNVYKYDEGIVIKFDTDSFWNWVRQMSVSNYVFVSEYEGPPDFKRFHVKDKEYLFFL